MGMAASQARFLQLTARKTNLEYMGQQINQERLALANESAGLFEKQLTMVPPTPPSSLDDSYYTPAYTFVDPVDNLQKKVKLTFDAAGDVDTLTFTYTKYNPDGSYSDPVTTTLSDGGAADGTHEYVCNYDDGSGGIDAGLTYDADTGRMTQMVFYHWNGASSDTNTITDLTYSPEFDEDAFNDDMNKYEYEKATYDYEVERINLETERIQRQDKSLELKLKQLDTEHNAIQTEIDAVQKVIQKNVESSFKTFS